MTAAGSSFILALDQGTTSSRAILFDRRGVPLASEQREIRQIYPAAGEVEHDPEEIWESQLDVARRVLAARGLSASDVAAIGVTNQRETTIAWERETGRPLGNAMVWQSRVSAPICEELRARGLEPLFRARTGLPLDPYFSGTKLRHVLDARPGSRERAARGEILFGTVDTWLIWRLTGGRVHATDPSNASRTLLFDIRALDWDDELLAALDVPRAMLPEVHPSSAVFGETDPALFGGPIPIAGDAGDQQAATFGQACFAPGMAKNTYGTGCFLLLTTGERPIDSRHGLLTTVGWQAGGRTTYCLEGSVFVGGAAVQWLRDGLRVIRSSAEVERLAAAVPDAGGVYVVPAFVGMGAPYWDPRARGAILGLTRGSTIEQIARATVDSMAYQVRDVLEAMQADAGLALAELRVDGGAAVNDALLQFQADLLGVPVERPTVRETTALGAAYLAGLAVGYWADQAEIAANWALERRFEPMMDEGRREALYRGWKRAVGRALAWDEG